jgi:hypothetical protein
MTLLLAASPLEQLLNHPQLLVVIVAGIAWALKLVGKASSAAARKAGPSVEGERREAEEAEEAARRSVEDEERARRVREEILRKIAERRAQATGAPPPAPPRVRRVPPPIEPPRVTVIPVEAVASRAPAPPTFVSPLPAARPPPASIAAMAHGPAPVSPWLEELRTPDAARRAILLREILGPPVALR